MLDTRKLAEVDQSIAGVVETLPPLCWRMFDALVKKGIQSSGSDGSA